MSKTFTIEVNEEVATSLIDAINAANRYLCNKDPRGITTSEAWAFSDDLTSLRTEIIEKRKKSLQDEQSKLLSESLSALEGFLTTSKVASSYPNRVIEVEPVENIVFQLSAMDYLLKNARAR